MTLKNQEENALNTAARLLVVTVWSSSLLFGLYILAFYFAALIEGNMTQWNEILPGIYDDQKETATIGIGIHFAAGGVILILGCIQFIERIREKHPAIHIWLGRLYILSCFSAVVGGLIFISRKGTIGGIQLAG